MWGGVGVLVLEWGECVTAAAKYSYIVLGYCS